jgi:6,7-dimethyl-8-ribityllumazine synthase
MPSYEGHFSAAGLNFGIIVARFNGTITELLLEGALDCLKRHGANLNDVDIVKVPGSFEIPLTAKKMAASHQYDALICLGVVVRGETAHFEHVSAQAASGVLQASLQTEIPIIFSILTVETRQQAEERAGMKMGNAGFTGAMSAIEMANLLKTMTCSQSLI